MGINIAKCAVLDKKLINYSRITTENGEIMLKSKKNQFKSFIESICTKLGCSQAAAPIQKGFDALVESRNADDEPPSEDELHAAKLVWQAYDFDYARSYGPEAAYTNAKKFAVNHGVDPMDIPFNYNAYEERFGVDIEEPEENQPWFNAVIGEPVCTGAENGEPTFESRNWDIKQSWIRKIRKNTEPLIRGLHKDDNWSSVYKVFDFWHKQFPELKIDVSVPDGGYSGQSENGMPSRKSYQLDVTTPEGVNIVGQLHCDAAGRIDDPFSLYDMTLLLN